VLCFLFFFAIFAFFALHFSLARGQRSLSLPARCAFVMTEAQRAQPRCGWPLKNAGN
jgi:hypothetical protein